MGRDQKQTNTKTKQIRISDFSSPKNTAQPPGSILCRGGNRNGGGGITGQEWDGGGGELKNRIFGQHFSCAPYCNSGRFGVTEWSGNIFCIEMGPGSPISVSPNSGIINFHDF